MKTNLRILTAFAGALGVILAVGCASHSFAPRQTGFLTRYNHLSKVDDTTWRYINTNRLALYKRFQITAAKVMVTEYDGRPIPPSGQQKAADYLRNSVARALSDRYPIVDAGGADVAEIRVAITEAYKSGNRLGLTIEGEIIDSYSTVQAGAVMRSRLGEAYLGDWWDATSATEMMDSWAARLREVIDAAHPR